MYGEQVRRKSTKGDEVEFGVGAERVASEIDAAASWFGVSSMEAGKPAEMRDWR